MFFLLSSRVYNFADMFFFLTWNCLLYNVRLCIMKFIIISSLELDSESKITNYTMCRVAYILWTCVTCNVEFVMVYVLRVVYITFRTLFQSAISCHIDIVYLRQLYLHHCVDYFR